MADAILVYTPIYVLLAVCAVFPPKEFIAAGFSIENLFSRWLGSEDVQFIQYHLRRTTLTMIAHALLPLGYYVGLHWFAPELDLLSYYWKLYLITVSLVAVSVGILCFHMIRQKWKNHPIATVLAKHATNGEPWFTVASAINIEFRRIDKFSSITGYSKLYVTDSWIIKTGLYSVNVAHQSDVHLTLTKSDEYALHHELNSGAQFLNITVSSVNDAVTPFDIRLNSLEYRDMKDKLKAPVRNARNIIIHQTLSERFLEAFRQLVDQNEQYHLSDAMEIEPCIGCMQTPANIKLVKLCDEAEAGDCVQCYCRPMWCLECMGRWFASRQDQSRADTWLSSKCPCPTCRSKFCILDVCRIAPQTR